MGRRVVTVSEHTNYVSDTDDVIPQYANTDEMQQKHSKYTAQAAVHDVKMTDFLLLEINVGTLISKCKYKL